MRNEGVNAGLSFLDAKKKKIVKMGAQNKIKFTYYEDNNFVLL